MGRYPSRVSPGSLALCLPSVCISGLLEFKRESGEDKESKQRWERQSQGKRGEAKRRHSSKHQKGIKLMESYSLPLHTHSVSLSCGPRAVPLLRRPASSFPHAPESLVQGCVSTGPTGVFSSQGRLPWSVWEALLRGPMWPCCFHSWIHERPSEVGTFTKAYWVPTL